MKKVTSKKWGGEGKEVPKKKNPYATIQKKGREVKGGMGGGVAEVEVERKEEAG
jgi:hypothetical protein